MKKLLIAISLAACATVAHAGGKVAYDPDAQWKQQRFDESREMAFQCMLATETNSLRMGERDTDRIITFADDHCGSGVRSFLTSEAGVPRAKAQALTRAMARATLEMVPGVSGLK